MSLENAEGNNNPYCQDNELSWFNWNALKRNKELSDFVSKLTKIRKQHIANANSVESKELAPGIAAFLLDNETLVAFNMSDAPIDLLASFEGDWKCLIHTSDTPDLTLSPNSSLVAVRKRL